MANKITAASSILSLEKMQSAFIQATQQQYHQAFQTISEQLYFEMFNRSYIEIKKWYGSYRRSVVKYKQNLEDKGTVLIHWVK